MGINEEVEKRFFGNLISQILKKVGLEAFDKVLELGIWGIILKFYFGLTWKTFAFTLLVITILSTLKILFYKEDLFLAFAILLVFQESLLLAWMLYVYLCYFRGMLGFYFKERRESERYSSMKSGWIGNIGQYVLPISIILIGNKFREIRDNIFFLVFLAFFHHMNYFMSLITDIIINRKQYRKEEVRSLLVQGIKDTRLNLAITIVFLLIFKSLFLTYAYSDASWGIFDYVFEAMKWII
jgi:hypothetical protein